MCWWTQQIAKCLFVVSSYTSAQLVKIAHSKVMRIIDDNGIRIRNVNTTFNNRSRDQHIEFSFNEFVHHFFQVFSAQLSMTNANAHIWTYALNQSGHFAKILNAVVHEENLTSALHFVADCIANNLFSERNQFGTNRDTIRWRGLNNT